MSVQPPAPGGIPGAPGPVYSQHYRRSHYIVIPLTPDYGWWPQGPLSLVSLWSGTLGVLARSPRQLLSPKLWCWRPRMTFPPPASVSTCRLPKWPTEIKRKYFLLRLWREPLLVGAHTRRATKPHVPIAMLDKSQFRSAVVAPHLS